MSSIAVTAVVLACLVGGSLLGMFLRGVLPEHHLSQQSTDVIKLGTGLMATLAALVLSLLISSAKTTNEIVKNEMTQSLANIVVLDRYLAQYGPETRDVRELIRRAMIRKLKATWTEESFEPIDSGGPSTGVTIESLQSKLQALSPHDDAQKWFLSRSLQITDNLAQMRGLLVEQGAENSIPLPFLIVLIFWTTIIFLSFGLLSRPNGTVIVTLFVCAVAVAGAIFLILELSTPFSGLIQISSAPAREALANLGR